MKVYRLEKECVLPGELKEVWDFFSTPLNLNAITPDDLQFEILTDLEGQKMYPGMIIQYKVKPFLGIPLSWVTEISHCEEPHRFVDEQRFGPYAFWHHKHIFEPLEGGQVKMIDIVDYAIGWGFLGRIANAVFVGKKVKEIFDHRNEVVTKYFSDKSRV